MELRRFIQQFNPPCDKCPYKLGLVQTLINPCPQCKASRRLNSSKSVCQENIQQMKLVCKPRHTLSPSYPTSLQLYIL